MKTIAVLSVLLMLAAVAPTGNAELLAAYDLVGEDALADAHNPIVTGQDIPESLVVLTVGRGKYDIQSLEMSDQPEHVQIKMNMGASYIGTSSMVYLTYFTILDAPYFVCWNINSAGVTTNYQDIGENLDLGCSRFNAFGTRVGPTTRANGVETGTDAAARVYVRWEVPRSAIGDAPAGTPISAVWSETWVRGVSTCCPPSTSPQSQYIWNIADRAPDTEAWTYTGGGAIPASPNLTVTPNNVTIPPGTNATAEIEATLNSTTSLAFNLTTADLPTGWNITFDESNGTLSADTPWNTTLTIAVPAGTSDGTYNFTIELVGAANATTSANFTVVVDSTLLPSPTEPTAATSNATTSSSEPAAVAKTQEPGIPGPTLVIAVAAVLAGLAMARRRR